MTKKCSTFAISKNEEACIKSFKNKGEFSSAGSEHLPYKQGVTGSNPVTPTNDGNNKLFPFFFNIYCNSVEV